MCIYIYIHRDIDITIVTPRSVSRSTPRWRSGARRARLGKGRMGSALMGSLQIL